jgi:peptide/nickel transport system permease protein
MAENRLAHIGFAVLCLLVVTAALAPQLAPHDPANLDLPGNLQGSSLAHPLGQDKLGRDILSRIIYGARVSLKVGVATVGISLVIGLLIGSVAGYAGRWVDETIMRIIDVLMAFPGILLAIAITAVLGPSLNHVILALCLTGWVGYARLIRGQVLAVREREYVQAAQAIGAGPLRILGRHILPNTLAPIIVEATFGMAGAILAEAGLSFVVLGFNFLGDGLRDWMDVQRN